MAGSLVNLRDLQPTGVPNEIPRQLSGSNFLACLLFIPGASTLFIKTLPSHRLFTGMLCIDFNHQACTQSPQNQR